LRDTASKEADFGMERIVKLSSLAKVSQEEDSRKNNANTVEVPVKELMCDTKVV